MTNNYKELYQILRDSYYIVLINRYIEWLKVKNFSIFTIESRRKDLTKFIIWLDERLIKVSDVTLSIIERYQSKLANQVTRKGTRLQPNSQANALTAIKSFFSYLAKNKIIESNPASEIEFPKQLDKLPKHILTHKEVELILSKIDITNIYGLRDRAMIELIYSTGIRRAEVAKVHVADIDFARCFLFVRCGKGNKDRSIPMGQRAACWIEKYLAESRPLLLAYGDKVKSPALEPQVVEELFINRYAVAFSVGGIGTIVKYYVEKAKLPEGSCHMFRHTMATLMLENGADIRYIQQMLGHRSLTTTQVYTKVSNRMLQLVHARTHPAASLLGKIPLSSKDNEVDEVEQRDDDI